MEMAADNKDDKRQQNKFLGKALSLNENCSKIVEETDAEGNLKGKKSLGKSHSLNLRSEIVSDEASETGQQEEMQKAHSPKSNNTPEPDGSKQDNLNQQMENVQFVKLDSPRKTKTVAVEGDDETPRKEKTVKCHQPKKNKLSQDIADYFSEFSDNTGIHGCRYIASQERLLLERLFWVIFFGISLYICIDLIVKTWIKWDAFPVLVSFARNPTSVWNIPFPAITICPEMKIRQREYNFTHFYHAARSIDHNMTATEMSSFTAATLICNRQLYDKGNDTVDFEGITYLMKIAPQFDETFLNCNWMGYDVSCREFFSPVLTEDGFCFTANMIDRNEIYTKYTFIQANSLGRFKYSEGWTLEDGYPKGTGTDTYPRRAMASGASAGLFLTLRSYKQDTDFVCRGPVQGFKLLLHHPLQIPRISMQYFRAPFNQEVIVSVTPDIMTTSDGLKSYEAHHRRCFYAEERKLFFYKTYTEQNCQVECLANLTLSHCGCVAFYMPHRKKTPICGSGSIKCVYQVKQDSLVNQVNTELNSSITDCDCLPACTSISYNAETSQAVYEWPRMYESLRKNLSQEEGLQLTRVGVFFKEMQFITSERNELYGITDFLANCGGVLGLFTGLSFLSIIEIFYFLTLRLACNIIMYGKSRWAGIGT